jgi:hypothetical protein
MNRTVGNSSSRPVWPRIDVARPNFMDYRGQNESTLTVLPKPLPCRQAFRQGSGNMPFQNSQYFSQRPVGSEVVREYCGALSGKVS